MRIPRQIVDQIYRAINIVEVIGDYVPLKKRGQQYWGLSPFKAEKTPSFSVHPGKNIFKDFSTGIGGNAVTFIMEIEKCSYVEALLHLARKYHIAVTTEESDDEQQAEEQLRQQLYSLNKFAAGWFQEQLASADKAAVANAYIHKRGFDKVTVEKFMLGYCPSSWSAFANAAIAHFYSPEILVASGLCGLTEPKDNQTEPRLYDKFRGRVIFPILDTLGRIAGFGGRLLETDAQAAKYINSSESPVYQKSDLLYGFFYARQEIRARDECILVEGYTDVISLHQAGITNAVASAGTSLTESQVKLINRFTQNILIIYDGDTAGIKASLRAIDLLLEKGMYVRLLLLPDDHDPDSYIRQQGENAFREYAKANAVDFVAYQYKVLGGDSPDPKLRAQALAAITQSLAHMPDPLQRAMYIQHTAAVFQTEEKWIVANVEKEIGVLKKLSQQQARLQAKTTEVPITEALSDADQPPPEGGTVAVEPHRAQFEIPKSETYYQEQEICRLLLNYADAPITLADENGTEQTYALQEIIISEFSDDNFQFSVPLFERIRQAFFTAYQQQITVPIEDLKADPDPNMRRLVADLLFFPYETSENWLRIGYNPPALDQDLAKTLWDCLYNYKRVRIEQLLRENTEKLKTNMSMDEMEKVMQVHRKLQQLRNDLLLSHGTVVPPQTI